MTFFDSLTHLEAFCHQHREKSSTSKISLISKSGSETRNQTTRSTKDR